jgi:hypothetical protein
MTDKNQPESKSPILYSSTPIPEKTIGLDVSQTPKSRYFQVEITGSFAQPEFTVWRLIIDPGDNNLMIVPDDMMLVKMDLQELKKVAVTAAVSHNGSISVYVTFPDLQEYVRVPNVSYSLEPQDEKLITDNKYTFQKTRFFEVQIYTTEPRFVPYRLLRDPRDGLVCGMQDMKILEILDLEKLKRMSQNGLEILHHKIYVTFALPQAYHPVPAKAEYSLEPHDKKLITDNKYKYNKTRFFEVWVREYDPTPFLVYRKLRDPRDNLVCGKLEEQMLEKMDIKKLKELARARTDPHGKIYVTFTQPQ